MNLFEQLYIIAKDETYFTTGDITKHYLYERSNGK